MLKKLFLVAVLAAVSSTFAQTIGVRAGLNLANMKFEDVDMPDLDNLIGFHVGVVSDIGITNMFYIQPGLYLTLKGIEYNVNMMGLAKIEATANLYYLEVPVLASAKVPINEATAIRINAGPYVGYGIGGTSEIKMSIMGQNETMSEKSFSDAGGFKRLDFGLNFGAGVEYQKFYLGISYGLGLANIANNDAEIDELDEEDVSSAKAYNRVLGFTVGYNF